MDEEPKFSQILGWCSDQKTQRLMKLAEDCSANFIVELGIYGGKSIIPMATILKKKNKGICFGIDPWNHKASIEGYQPSNKHFQWWNKLDHDSIYHHFMNMRSKFKVEEQLVVLRGYSQQYYCLFADDSLDILHIDANHSEECSQRDVKQWAHKVKKGGYIVMDDIDWETVQVAINNLLEMGFVEIENYNQWALYQRI